MADVALLGLELDSRKARDQARALGGELDNLGKKGTKAKDGVKGVGTESTKASKGIGDMAKESWNAEKAMAKLATAAGALAAIAALAKIMREATAAALEFNKAMAEVSTLLPDTDDLAAVSLEVRRLSVEFNQAPVDQARAMYQVISAGAKNAAEASKILEVANRLAVGGVTDVATAADGLTSLLNAYGLAAGDALGVSDALFVAMKAGKTTIGELSGALGKVAPLAAQVGIGIDELTGATAALTKGGISTEIAVTGLRAIMAAVVKPTSEAATEAARLGIEFNATALKTQGLAGFMETLVTASNGSTDSLAQLFGGVEALVPALALAGQAGTDLDSILLSMGDKAGATGAAFEKIASSDAYRLEKAINDLKDVTIDLGNAILVVLVPAMELAAKALRNVGGATKLATAIVTGDGARMIEAIHDLSGADREAAVTARKLADALEVEHNAMVRLPPTLEEFTAAQKKLRDEQERSNTAQKNATASLAAQKKLLEEVAKVFREAGVQAKYFNDALDVMAQNRGAGGIIAPTGPQMSTAAVSANLPLVTGGMEDLGISFGDLLDKVSPLLSGLASIADAMGMAAAKAIRGAADIFSGIDNLGKGGAAAAAGGIAGIVGGTVALLSTLFAPDEAAKQREEQRNKLLQDNNQRLYDMTQALMGQGTTQGQFGQAGGIAQALGDYLQQFQGSKAYQYAKGDVTTALGGGGGFEDIFSKFGLSVEAFNAIVKETGITLFDSAGRLIPDALAQLVAATQNSIAALAQEQAAFDQNIQVRSLMAQGLTDEADILRQAIANEKELIDAQQRGLDVTALIAVQEEEATARAQAKAEAQAKANAAMNDELGVRELLAQGKDKEAAILRKEIEQRNELAAAIASGTLDDDTIQRLKDVLGLEWDQFIEGLESLVVPLGYLEGFAARRATLNGDDRGALSISLNARADEEIAYAQSLYDAGAITQEVYESIVATIRDEVNVALADFDQALLDTQLAAVEAALAIDLYNASVMEDLAVRNLYAAGKDKEAKILAQDIRHRDEYTKAVEAGATPETLAAIKSTQQAEKDFLKSQLYAVNVTVSHTSAVQRQAAAVRETTKAVEEAARVLNAPSGLRLSLLRWRASAFNGFAMPSSDTNQKGQAVFNFGKEAIVIQAAKGESGDSLLNRVLGAANTRARAGAGNVFTTLPEEL